MSALPPELDVGRDEALDKARWDRAMAWIAAKLRTHDAFQPSWETAVNELREFGLARLNDAVLPVYNRLNQIAQIGAMFTASSATSLAVGTGPKVLEVAEADRPAFAASAYLAIQKIGDPTIAMWGPLQSYDRSTGLLSVLVEHAVGSGSTSGWRVSASGAPDAEHAGRTDNPHGVTAAQVGAPTTAEMASAIASAIADIKAGVGPAWDTLQEIAAYIAADQTAGAGYVTALANRVRVDAAQGLDGTQQAQARANIYAAPASGVFYKPNTSSVAFIKTGAGTLSLKAGIIVDVAGSVIAFSADTAVTMPALAAGTDYAVYVCADGSVRADASFTAPAGYTVGNSRQIGGFHYAPGGNATAQAGGDAIPAINPHSMWDLKWRPAASDPRGMALIGGAFWADIYLLGVDHHLNGTSKYNVTIADGSSPPKVPSAFGGNGSATYSALTWWQASECMQAAGKNLLSVAEFAAAAYGTTEATAGGTDPVSTVLRQATTSKWGVMLATGNLWVWSRDWSMRWDGAGGWAYRSNAEGRGQQFIGGDANLVAVLLGGHWNDGAIAGSRASAWGYYPWSSGANVGARGRCDHLQLA